MSLATGTVLDHYRIDRPVGSGAFATVYLAHDDRFDDSIAVKVLAENRALDIDARRRFVEEAQKLRSVQCPAIVTVFDIGETESNQPYMVLEYADRGDLAARRAANTAPLSPADVMRIVDFLAVALGSLHEAGLVHRDVKPHNILIASGPPSPEGSPQASQQFVGPHERLLLGDLGFVKDLDAASGLTSGGGTIAFRAPEQARPVSTIDRRADLYSASAVLAWLVTGAVPMEAEGWGPALSQLGQQRPDEATHSFIAELAHGLAPEPGDRPPDVEQWRSRLHHALGFGPHGTQRRHEPAATALTGARRQRRWPWVGAVAAGAIFVATLGATGAWALLGDSSSETRTIDGVSSTETAIGDGTAGITGSG